MSDIFAGLLTGSSVNQSTPTGTSNDPFAGVLTGDRSDGGNYNPNYQPIPTRVPAPQPSTYQRIGSAVARVSDLAAHDVNNDVIKPINRDVVKPVVSGVKQQADVFAQKFNQNILQPLEATTPTTGGQETMALQTAAQKQSGKLSPQTMKMINKVSSSAGTLQVYKAVADPTTKDADVQKTVKQVLTAEDKSNKQMIGAGLTAASLALGGGSLTEAILGTTPLASTVVENAAAGAIGGEGGTLVTNPEASIKQQAEQTGLGAGFGAVLGGAAYGAGKVGSTIVNKITGASDETPRVSDLAAAENTGMSRSNAPSGTIFGKKGVDLRTTTPEPELTVPQVAEAPPRVSDGVQPIPEAANETVPGAKTPYDTPEIVAMRKAQDELQPTHLDNSPARQQVRAEAYDTLDRQGGHANPSHTPEVIDQNKHADIVLGPPASGKSRIVDPLLKNNNARLIDSDEAKPLLGDVNQAGALHKESDLVTQALYDKATESGDNIVYPLVGKNPDRIKEVVEDLQSKGYKTDLHYNHVSPEIAAQRAVTRFQETGRFVDPHYVYNEVGLKPQSTYDIIKQHEGINTYKAYTNEVKFGEQPRLLESGGLRQGSDVTGRSQGSDSSRTEPTEVRSQIGKNNTENAKEIDGYRQSKDLVKDYASTLRSQDAHAKGGILVPDGEGGKIRTSEHTPFYREFFAENKKAPTMTDYQIEAEKQLLTGKDQFGAGDTYGRLLARENGMGEAGFAAPGQAISDVRDLLNKHSESVKYSGDLQRFSDSTEGEKTIIAQDAAKLLKGREEVTPEDKALLQEYRDRKAAGLPTEPLPDHLKNEDIRTTELNRAAQIADAERAKLNGNEQKAISILARDPETYTHRIAQDKGGAWDYLLQNDRKSPVSVNRGKTTPGDKNRIFHALTDENGNRTVASIKSGRVTSFENGELKADLGNFRSAKNEDLMQKELMPINKQIDNLNHEKTILTSSKGRTAVTETRVANIDKKVDQLVGQQRDIINKYDLNELDNKKFTQIIRDENGKITDRKQYTIGQATTSEISKATGQKYYVDPQLTALANYVDSRTALENAKFIETLKTAPEFKQFATPPGETAPKGWKSVQGFQQLPGYKFDPRTADTIKDIMAASSGDKDALDHIGRFLRQTIVYFPVKHDINIVTNYVVDRGASKLLSPLAYKRGASSLIQAIDEVTHNGPMYQKLLKNGFGLPSADTHTFEQEFAKQIKTLVEDKSTLDPVAKALSTTPARLIQAYKSVQHTSVWEVQDILNVARVLERMKPTLLSRGASFEDAMKDTARFNFQYKVPSRVAGSRNLSRFLQSDKVFFGRYRYDQWKIFTNTLKDSVNILHPKQAGEALDKLAVIALGIGVGMPIVNKLVQNISGNPNAHFSAPGSLGLPDTFYEMVKGQESPSAAISGQAYISGGLQMPLDIKNNKDSFTGQDIYDPNTSPANQGKQILSWIEGQLAPVQKVKGLNNSTSRVAGGVLSLVGASLPKNSPETNKLQSLKYDSLPMVTSTVKELVGSNKDQQAQAVVNEYNASVLKAAKQALKAAGKPVPSDAQLTSNLRRQYFLYTTPIAKTANQAKNPKPPLLTTLSR